MSDTIFNKIITREIPAEIVYEDELCIAFKDIAPKAPVHILLVPKTPITNVASAQATDQSLLGHLLLQTAHIAEQQGYGDAYRLVINNGEKVGQTVFHLHIHILAGREFSWPPG